MLRAENAEVLVLPEDRKYGALLIGGQGAGKSAALLRFFLNDIASPDAAPLVIDPKPELALLCLKLTPPRCAKRVWYLDLGRPAFGMNPLRLVGDRPLPIEAAQVAENIVAALLDINANQIFQSSRRYLYHAVIGAIALAKRSERRPKFEDVYTLLLPAKADFRSEVAEACADQPDLDQTAAFFASELPDELRIAGSATAQRLDAPRNKIAGLTQVPALRRFFNHPTDIPLREIIEARDILIVDANMGAIGQDNSKACMHFILRLLHTQMQRQVHRSEHERPRVPLLIDEAHYVLGAENVIDQFATHRRAGLEPACGLQYFAQLGSGSEHEQKIRKGALNLLQSRFLFRMGDAQDAEEAARIAMAVYSTMIRDDPDSRARLRVTPEQLLNFPNHYCLASWIADGTRIPSFIGQTYQLPDCSDEWAQHHLAQQAQRVAPYPETLESTLDPAATRPAPPQPARRTATVANASRRRQAHDGQSSERPVEDDVRRAPADLAGEPSKADRSAPVTPAGDSPRREVQVDFEPPAPAPDLATSPVRRVVGQPLTSRPAIASDEPAPDTLRELAYLDRINEIGRADQLDGATALPRLYDEDYAILALLDRAGLVPATLIGRAVLLGRAPRTVADRLVKLYRHGLIAKHATALRGHTRQDGKPPTLYSLTRRGMAVAQARQPTPAISQRREWRAIEQARAARLAHDLHALAWGIQLHRTVGDVATDHWRTPRYATGRYPVPQGGNGRARHQITLNEIPVPAGQAIIDLQLKTFVEVKPDLSLELRITAMQLTFDLLVELDLTARPSYNRDKFLAYDAFLCGWSLAHRRYHAQGTRPAVVFVCPDARSALALAREADEAMTGRLGALGTPPEHWYHPGRDHTFFAVEGDIHRGRPTALALPPAPPALRERLQGSRELRPHAVTLVSGGTGGGGQP